MRYVWLIGGVVLAGVGVYLMLTALSRDDFGWFAYVPAWDDFETDASLTVFTRQSLVGAGLLALGAVVVSGGVGYLLGRRQR